MEQHVQRKRSLVAPDADAYDWPQPAADKRAPSFRLGKRLSHGDYDFEEVARRAPTFRLGKRAPSFRLGKRAPSFRLG